MKTKKVEFDSTQTDNFNFEIRQSLTATPLTMAELYRSVKLKCPEITLDYVESHVQSNPWIRRAIRESTGETVYYWARGD